MLIISRRRKLDTLALLDAIAPGVVVAQAIGRWGNYFNQELFGRPTRLPWATRDRSRAPPAQLRAIRDVPADVSLRVDLVSPRIFHNHWSRATTGDCARGRRSRSTSRCTASVVCSSSGCASTRRQGSSEFASTCCLPAVLCVIGTICVHTSRAPRALLSPPLQRFRVHPDRHGPRHSITCSPERAEGVAVTATSPPTTAIASRTVGASKIYGKGETEVRALDNVERRLRARRCSRRSWARRAPASRRCCIASRDSTRSRAERSSSATSTSSSLSEKNLTQVRRDRIGFVFQAYNLIPTLTARGEHHAAPGARRAEARSSVGRLHRRDRRAAVTARPPAVRALRRAATARRGRARAREPARDRVRRRADRKPRLQARARNARVHEAARSKSSARPS